MAELMQETETKCQRFVCSVGQVFHEVRHHDGTSARVSTERGVELRAFAFLHANDTTRGRHLRFVYPALELRREFRIIGNDRRTERRSGNRKTKERK